MDFRTVCRRWWLDDTNAQKRSTTSISMFVVCCCFANLSFHHIVISIEYENYDKKHEKILLVLRHVLVGWWIFPFTLCWFPMTQSSETHHKLLGFIEFSGVFHFSFSLTQNAMPLCLCLHLRFSAVERIGEFDEMNLHRGQKSKSWINISFHVYFVRLLIIQENGVENQ